jgi:hypothetical protein
MNGVSLYSPTTNGTDTLQGRDMMRKHVSSYSSLKELTGHVILIQKQAKVKQLKYVLIIMSSYQLEFSSATVLVPTIYSMMKTKKK